MKIAYVTSQFPCGPNEAFLSSEIVMLARYTRDILIVPVRPRTKHAVQETGGAPVTILQPFGLSTMLRAMAEVVHRPARVLRLLAQTISAPYRLSSKIKNFVLFPKALAVSNVVRSSGVEHIHAHWLSTPATIAYIAASLNDIPWSCTAHRFDLFEDNLVEQKVQSAKFIRAISERTRTIIREKSRLPINGSCKVVHLGVAVPQRTSQPVFGKTLRIVCCAQLVPVKGHDVLIDALDILRRRGVAFDCDLVGDGPQRPSIEAHIRRLRLHSMVTLRGEVEHDRLCADLQRGRYDVAVLASTEHGNLFEGVPVSLMEAMAAGIPCVATRTGSIPELINDQACSRLVPQGDAGALADALEELHRDHTQRVAVSRAARARIEEAFDARETARALYELMSS